MMNYFLPPFLRRRAKTPWLIYLIGLGVLAACTTDTDRSVTIEFTTQNDQFTVHATDYQLALADDYIAIKAGEMQSKMKLSNFEGMPTLDARNQEVIYKEAFNKANLIVYDKGSGNAGYDIQLQPRGNIADVQLELEDAENAYINQQGQLIIPKDNGSIIKHSKPYAYQEIDGQQIKVDSRFALAEGILSFEVGDYNRDYELVIDPEISFMEMPPCMSGLGGRVFYDTNNNGVEDGNDFGQENIGIEVYQVGATNPTITTTSDANGDWSVSDAGLTYPVRVEFVLPSTLNLDLSAVGTDNRTATQFVDGSSCEVTIGVFDPSKYNTEDANVIVPCFVNGDPLAGGTSGSEDAIVRVPYTATGTSASPSQPAPEVLVYSKHVGAIWGNGYQIESGRTFLSGLVRRHVGLGVGGLGGIYLIEDSDNATTVPLSAPADELLFVDLENAPYNFNFGTIPSNSARGLPANFTATSRDTEAYDGVGKLGIGDIDIDETDDNLWIVNLFNRSLIKLDVSGSTPGTAIEYPLTGLPGWPSCVNGEARPWGLTFYEGRGYLGVTCTGENGGSQADMFAYVFSFDPNNPTTLTNELDVDLTYLKGQPSTGTGSTAARRAISLRWNPWVSTYVDSQWASGSGGFESTKSRPMPILSDIVFDGLGGMTIGFIDRGSFMLGQANLRPDPSQSGLISNVSAGEILRACLNSTTNRYDLENNGSCGGVSGLSNNQGPGGGEFYWQDRYFTNNPNHEETGQGALAQIYFADLTVTIALDPLNFASGGLEWFKNTDPSSGSTPRGYQVFRGGIGDGIFAKSTGLGDIELTSVSPTLQVGNYVWVDEDEDGVQDANEPSAVGVSVSLYDKTNPLTPTFVASTTTDIDGEYYFDSIQANVDYGIVFGYDGATMSSQFDPLTGELSAGLSVYTLTDEDSGEGNQPDVNDSDATLMTLGTLVNYPVIMFNTDSTNYTYDVGLVVERTMCPQIDDTNLQDVVRCNVDSFILATIMGTDLTGREAFFTEPGGRGLSFENGDTITIDSSLTLYAYDRAVTYPTGGANLEAMYSFEQNNNDSSGNGNDPQGNANNAGTAATYSMEAIEGSFALDLNGTNDEVLFNGTVSNMSFNDAFTERTIATWIRPDDTSGVQIIFEQGSQIDGFSLRLNDGELQAGIAHANNNGSRFIATGPIRFPLDGRYHHVAAVFDNGILTAYIDGAPGVSVDTQNPMVDAANNQQAGIGRNFGGNAFNQSNNGGYFDGLIDNVKIIAAAEPPIILCKDEVAFTINNTQFELNPSVICTDGTNFEVAVGIDYLGLANDVQVTFQGQMQTFTPTSPNGTDTVRFTAMTPAFNQLVEAAVVGLTDCEESILVDLIACTESCVDDLGGIVFLDLNNDGTEDPTDVGQSNILVEIYECDSDVPVATAYTSESGEWSVSDLNNYPYRVEFSTPLTPWLDAGASGADNGTDVQFVEAPSCEVNFGVVNPALCVAGSDGVVDSEDVLLITPCYVNGDAASTTGPTEVLVALDYDRVGGQNGNIYLADKDEIGSTWGTAYSRKDSVLFIGAFLKRHVGLKEGLATNPLGAIYQHDLKTGTNSLFVDVSTLGADVGSIPTNSGRGLPTNPATPNNDTEAFGQVGKVGLGDVDISDDEKTLFVMSLNDKTVYAIDIATQTLVDEYPMPDPGCVGGEFRPFALKYYQGSLYAGGICDAINSQSRDNLTATVYQLVGNTFVSVMESPIDYPKRGVSSNCPAVSGGGWFAWLDTFDANVWRCAGALMGYPQPILSDIEFDDAGDMILGFTDRGGHQMGSVNYPPSGTQTFSYVVGGDILKAFATDNGFELEDINNFNDEFYSGDFFSGGGGSHDETGVGGLAVLPTTRDVAMTGMDPTAFRTGGIFWLDNMDGTKERTYQIYVGNTPFFGKANGLGDLELVCASATIQVGNYVWVDEDEDGVQDACEPGAAQVKVSLYDKTDPLNPVFVASTVTDVDGQYIFEDIEADTPYGIVFGYDGSMAMSQFDPLTGELSAGLSVYTLTDEDSGEGNNPDLNDSDATLMTIGTLVNYPTIMFTTDSTDYSFDVGLVVERTMCPMIDDTNLQDEVLCNTSEFILPTIQGTDLTGMEAFYTEPGGMGMVFDNGDTVTVDSTLTLYAYDRAVTYPQGGTDLEAMYSFEEDNNDSSGNGNNPTGNANNAGTASTYSMNAIEGSFALDLNGTNDEVLFNGTVSNMSFNSAFTERTISAWILPDDTSGIQIIFEQGSQIDGFALRLNDGELQAGIAHANNNASRYIASGPKRFPLDGRYHHVAAVFDNGILTTYLDGIPGISVDTQNPMVDAATNQQAGIGRNFGGNAFNQLNNGGYFGGLIDNVKIIAAAEPPIFLCDDEVAFTISNTQFELSPRVICTDGTSFEVAVGIDFLGLQNDVEVTFQGQTQIFSPAQPNGTDTVRFTATTPAFDQLIEAQVVGLTDCEVATLVDLIACSEPCVDDLGGTVFNDFNNDGVEDMNETGQGNILVYVYECDNDEPVDSAYTNANGDWSVDDTNITYPVRVEFSTPLTPWLDPSAAGTDNGTDVQFVDMPSCEVDFGVFDEDEYCTQNPLMITNCYVNGATTSASGPDDVIVSGAYELEGIPIAFNGSETNPNTLATKSQIGATWGLAIDQEESLLYASAFLKRHVGLPNDATNPANGALGAIYSISLPNGSPQLFIDLTALGFDLGMIANDATRGLGAPADPSRDTDAYDKVGTVGFGDLDISDDGQFLFTVNLNTKTLLKIPTTNPTAANIESFQIPDPGCAPTTASFRPFAVAYHNGEVYVGGICDARGGSKSNLSAYIYKFNPDDNSQPAQIIFDYSLNYTKGPAGSTQAFGATCNNRRGWFPWTGSVPGTCVSDVIIYPTPMFTDIEFDTDGSLIMGYADRMGHMLGWRNWRPTGNNALIRNISGGDILRACRIGDEYVLQGGAGCSNNANNNQGPGGGEYYAGDFFRTSSGNVAHAETSSGGLAQLTSLGEVAVTVMDPLGTSTNSGGFGYFDNTSGQQRNPGYLLYRSAQSGAAYFGKAVGLGDVEAFCRPIPIQVGNYVWNDLDEDGVQDACEDPITNLIVKLYDDAGLLIGQDTTDMDGEYYFDITNVDTTGITVNGAGVATPTTGFNGLNEGEKYFIVFMGDSYDDATDQITANGVMYGLTTTDSGEGENPDQNDSDVSEMTVPNVGDMPVIMFVADSTDHTLDAGLTEPQEVILGAIGNYVWLDENSDGSQNAGEPGIPNVLVILNNMDGNPIDSTVTNTDGGYLFPDLPSAMYFVDVDETTLPDTDGDANTQDLTQTTIFTNVVDGSDADTDDDDGDFGNKDHSGDGYKITLDPGEENLTADFGYNYNPTDDVNDPDSSPLGAIGDAVWYDADQDGVQDPEEVGVEGVTIKLIAASDVTIDGTMFAPGDQITTTVTDETGFYIFDGLPAGAYSVMVNQVGSPIDGFDQTGDPDHFGESEADNPDDTVEDDNMTTNPIVLGPGDVFLNVDFGYDNDDDLGAIGDFVWLDADADGNGPNTVGADGITVNQGNAAEDDADETPIEGVTVSLIKDTDGDGKWDVGEPIIATDVTDENGLYYFPGLPAGNGEDYLVIVTDTDNILDGLKPTYDADGDAGTGNIVDVNPNDQMSNMELGLSSVMNLTAGAGNEVVDQDFGYTPEDQDPGEGVIGDYVWYDTDDDDVQDPDEPGIEGVIVELYKDLDNDNMITGTELDSPFATTVTDENGNYYFGGLPLDMTYQVIISTDPMDNPVLEGLVNVSDPDGDDDNEGDIVTLTIANPTDLDQDFGYLADPNETVGSIGNKVFEDTNANGVRDVGEPGINGVTIDLYRDLNGNGELDPGEPLIGSTTTNNNVTTDNPSGEDGMYFFDNLPLDDYIVDVTDEDGVLGGYWQSTSPNQDPTTNNGDDPMDNSKEDAFAVTIDGTIPDNTNVDFGYYKDPAAVGNYVWLDTDGNGLQDDGETGINGVEVSMMVTYPDGTMITLVTTTVNDAIGNPGFYEFTNLLLDEDYNGDGMGDEPTYTIKVDGNQITLTSMNLVPTASDVNSNGNDLEDSDNFNGVAAQPVQGNENTEAIDPETDEDVVASYDFGVAEEPILCDTNDECNYTADFEVDDAGNPLVAGSVDIFATQPYANIYGNGQGLTFSSDDQTNNPINLYNTDGTGGNDPDLERNSEGTNQWADGNIITEMLGNVLIINQTSDISDPNDNGSGGQMIVNSDLPLGRFAFDMVDLDLPLQGDVIYENTSTGQSVTIPFEDFEQGSGSIYEISGVRFGDRTANRVISVTADNLGLQFFDRVTFDLAAESGAIGVICVTVNQKELGAIGNYVWVDEDSDGLQDAGEPGIPNVIIILNDMDGNEIDRTITDSDGGYLFPDLPAAMYFVDVDETSLPTGMTQTTIFTNVVDGSDADTDDDDGDLGNKDHDGDGYKITLDPGEENLTADFGYNYNPTDDVNDPNGSPLGAIGDQVWYDADEDGVLDPEEVGVEGVTVKLIAASDVTVGGTPFIAGDQIATDVTDANGFYLFDDLPAGAYNVMVNQVGSPIDGFDQTGDPDHFGESEADNPDDTVEDDNMTTNPVILGPGDVFLNVDFGYNDPNVLGAIGDFVWLDADADGNGPNQAGADGVTVNQGNAAEDDMDEQPISGVSVALIKDTNGDGKWDAGEPIIANSVTDENGLYFFPGLPAGNGEDYLVVVTDTDNVLDGLKPTYDADGGTMEVDVFPTSQMSNMELGISSVQNLTAGSGNEVVNQDFGYTPEDQDPGEGVIGDYVWYDTDDDDVQDPDEPGLEGVIVELYKDLDNDNMITGAELDNPFATTVTDENGNYYFGGLPLDMTYQVIISTDPMDNPVLEGLVNVSDPDGDDNNEGDIVTLTISVPIDLDQDFGYLADPNETVGSIGNKVWEDTNANGMLDPGEMGINGVTIDLYRDLNGNGELDPGEPLIGSTTTNNNVTTDNPSGVDGMYLFDNLPLDDYIVDVTDEDGELVGYWQSTSPNQDPTTNSGDDPMDNSKEDAFAITIDATIPDNSNVDFGYYKEPAAVGNYVWEDTNGDGQQDDTEMGIENVVVQMMVTYPDGTMITVETTTDADGFYEFPNLLIDEDYRVGLGEDTDANTPEGTGVNGADPSTLNPSGTQTPLFVIKVDEAQMAITDLDLVPTLIDQTDGGITDKDDADDNEGVAAIPVQGNQDTDLFQTDPTIATANDEEVEACYDFAFRPAVNDLAAIIELDPDAGMYDIGDPATFKITVFNQGDTPTSDITITNYVPSALTPPADQTFTDAAMVMLNGGGTALFDVIKVGDTYTIDFGDTNTDWLQPDENVMFSITYTVNDGDANNVMDDEIINIIEISFFDINNDGIADVDVDSTPDETNDDNTGENPRDNGNDDVTDNSNGDEDDHDFAEITAANVLPVELLFFDAKADGDHIDLTWATASELNNSHFELERSEDAKSFKPIDRIEGQGTILETTEYAYADEDVIGGVVYYYRLKQVDIDGTTEYSDIRSVKLNKGDTEWTIYPNPIGADQFLQVEFYSESTSVAFYVMDVDGKQVMRVEQDLTTTGWQQIQIDVSYLPASTYMLVDEQGNSKQFIKINE
ncbi:MAG: SdrD B-like domain-containing protein [Bacteroidota bacterium]